MNDEISEAIASHFPDAAVEVALEGNRASIRVVSGQFAGMSRVQRQQAVYACIDRFITGGALHAVSIRALTPDEAS